MKYLLEVLQEAAALLGLDQAPISVGHAQTVGLMKRFNHTLKLKLLFRKGVNGTNNLGPSCYPTEKRPIHQQECHCFTSCMVKTLSYVPTALYF